MLPRKTTGCASLTMLALCASLGACQSKSQALDEEAMARRIRTLASLSAEAAFLTGELRAQHLKPSFAASHLQDLAQDAAKARQELAQPAASMLGQQHARAQALAQQLVDTLAALRRTQAGPDAQLEREQQAMLQLKSELDTLEASL
jgi:hypothetical protein